MELHLARTLLLVTTLSLLTGCTVPLTVKYIPTSLLTGQGEIEIETFHYIPADRGKLKPNQIQNTAVGSLLLNDNVDKFVSDAVEAEFKRVGYRIGNGNTVLQGDIEKLLADDLGYSVDWELTIVYRTLSKADGKKQLEKRVTVKLRSVKFNAPLWKRQEIASALYGRAISQAIRLSFEELIKDPNVDVQLKNR